MAQSAVMPAMGKGHRNYSKAQYARFPGIARQLGVDETGESYKRAFKKIVPPRQKKGSQAQP